MINFIVLDHLVNLQHGALSTFGYRRRTGAARQLMPVTAPMLKKSPEETAPRWCKILSAGMHEGRLSASNSSHVYKVERAE